MPLAPISLPDFLRVVAGKIESAYGSGNHDEVYRLAVLLRDTLDDQIKDYQEASGEATEENR